MDLKTVTKKGTKHQRVFRVGRGIGSGLGKTCGRGHKGWGARSGAPRRPGYEGGQMPIYRRVPKRGFTNARFRVDYTLVNIDQFEAFEGGEVVDMAAILAKGLASLKAPALKVLGNGALTKALTVRAQKFSKSAQEKIEAAGGKIVVLDARGREVVEGAEAEAPGKKSKKSAPEQAKAAKPEAAKAESAKPEPATAEEAPKPEAAAPESDKPEGGTDTETGKSE
jgi:large subunit ribosomal protein L15